MHIVIHPGMTKAGSTSIQYLFRQRESELADSGIGFVSPRGDLGVLVDRTLSAVDELRHDPGHPFTHVLISHESLFELKPAAIQSLLLGLDERECRVRCVVVARAVAPWLASLAKQRLKSLRGGELDKETPRVDVWFDNWTSPEVSLQLKEPLNVVDFQAAAGLLHAFVDACRFPMPTDWESWPTPQVNRSPEGRDLALYIVLNNAFRLLARGSEDVDVMADPEFKDLRSFIGRLASKGDHHRRPQDLAIDEKFRSELLHYLVDRLAARADELLADTESLDEFINLIGEAAKLAVPSRQADRLAESWNERFLMETSDRVRKVERRIREWCAKRERSDIASILLPS